MPGTTNAAVKSKLKINAPIRPVVNTAIGGRIIQRKYLIKLGLKCIIKLNDFYLIKQDFKLKDKTKRYHEINDI
jgi:hypothetical protein